MHQFLDDRRFAIVDLTLVLISGAVWMLKPEWGFWFILTALLPWVLRLLGGKRPFQKTQLDVLIFIFFITAIVGCWASYDQETAQHKFWLIAITVLLYYALSAQPKENLALISAVFFCIGVGVSLHYLLTYDFVGAPRKLQIANTIGRWLVEVRPQLGWTSIHPNYVAGIAAITTPFIFYTISALREKKSSQVLIFTLIWLGLAISLFAIFMATSRGIWMAIFSALGIWLLWRFINLRGINPLMKKESFFPAIVLIYLSLIIAVLYLGPANSVETFSSKYFFGTGSRAELFGRSLFILSDFPFTGGGLGAFPGLYSYYILGIPFFNVPNSHNMFLDVAIEQGLLGGVSFLTIFLMSIWYVVRAVAKSASKEFQLFNWLVLFAIVIAFIHGMVDDYLYNGHGVILALFLAGFSAIAKRESAADVKLFQRWDRQTVFLVSLISVCLITFLFLDKIFAIWEADLGAVQMAKVELVDFPNAGWAGIDIIPQLQQAETTLLSALGSDPKNLTANHDLGLIAMQSRDFQNAVIYLEKAHQQIPAHRGVTKALGYCYVWLSDFDKAQLLLTTIPEAYDELDVYTWWWKDQGRADLSDLASVMSRKLDSVPVQP